MRTLFPRVVGGTVGLMVFGMVLSVVLSRANNMAGIILVIRLGDRVLILVFGTLAKRVLVMVVSRVGKVILIPVLVTL